jgi:branched-subunit amino acid aminotransferase/4-amino-4-deoxychorismate lyase
MREIGLEELLKAEEVFITATSKEIIPIVKIDGNTIAKGKVGENTNKMMELFRIEKEKILKN